MTQDYSAILPVMIAVAVAYAVRRRLMDGDIYTLKLIRRGHIIPEGLISDLKAGLILDDIASKSIVYVSDMDEVYNDDDFACVQEDGKITGVIDLKNHHMDGKLAVDLLKKRPYIVMKSGSTALEAVTKLYKSNTDIVLISRNNTAEVDSIIGVLSSTHLVEVIGKVTETLR